MKMMSCGKWKHMPLNNDETILMQYNVHGNTRKLVLPEELDGYTVSEIYWQAIKGGSRLEKIVLPATLKRLNGCPYEERYGDVKLELDSRNCNLKILDGGTVTDSTGGVLMWLKKGSMMIGKPEDCKNRLQVTFVDQYPTMYYSEEEPLTEIGDFALAGWDSLQMIVVPEGVKRIGMGAFLFCGALECAELPDTVGEIGSFAFKACRKLKSFAMPENINKISRELFEDCIWLTEVSNTTQICSVGVRAFKGCGMLQKIELTDNCKRIDVEAFKDCVFLDHHDLWFDDDDCRTEWSAFRGCDELLRTLENVGKWRHERISDTETMITGHYPSDYIKTLVIPEEIDGYTVRAIEWRAIGTGRMIEKIVLPATLKRLNGWPYQEESDSVRLELDSGNSYLKIHDDGSVTDSAGEELMCFPNGSDHTGYEAPATLRVIGRRAFSCCMHLESIVLPDSVRVIEKDAFEGCSDAVMAKAEEYIQEKERRMKEEIDKMTDRVIDQIEL